MLTEKMVNPINRVLIKNIELRQNGESFGSMLVCIGAALKNPGLPIYFKEEDSLVDIDKIVKLLEVLNLSKMFFNAKKKYFLSEDYGSFCDFRSHGVSRDASINDWADLRHRNGKRG